MPIATTPTAVITSAFVAGAVTAAPAGALYVLQVPASPALDPSWLDFLMAFIGALVGAMHPLAQVDTRTNWQAVVYVSRWVATALIFTFFVTYAVEWFTKFPMHLWPGVVSFIITFMALRWETLLTNLLGLITPRTRRE